MDLPKIKPPKKQESESKPNDLVEEVKEMKNLLQEIIRLQVQLIDKITNITG